MIEEPSMVSNLISRILVFASGVILFAGAYRDLKSREPEHADMVAGFFLKIGIIAALVIVAVDKL